MRTVHHLATATRDKKVGNHRVEVRGELRSYIYFYTEICRANLKTNTFWIDDSYGTVSTTRACNAYRRYYSSMGFVEVPTGTSLDPIQSTEIGK